MVSASDFPRSISRSNEKLPDRQEQTNYFFPAICWLSRRSLPQLRSEVLAKVSRLKDRTDLHLSAAIERSPLQPIDRLVHRPHLPNPETGDQLFGFRERSIDDHPLITRELHPLPLRTGLQPVARQHDACFHQLFVVLPHLGEDLSVRQNPSLGILVCLYDDHDSHCDVSSSFSFSLSGPTNHNPRSIYKSNEQ